jgi:phage gpG-like protein
MKFSIEVEGKEQLLSSFLEVQEGVVDLRKLGTWDWVATEFRKIEKEIFDSEGSASRGGRWKELSTKYKERKLRKWGPVPILQASGKLYRALSGTSPDSVFEKEAQSMAIGTSLPYARYHQTGTKRMPKRPPMDFTDEQKDRLVEPIKRKLRQLIANAKLAERRGF